ncbi:MAG: aldehyde dehydrogenase family protein [Pseudomonadales bacterium]|jgi:vanillin dehydrogenase|uniref:aldehyde dehydrogenase family protein n=1 Tax=uncultured Planktomarina sp. TaxID=1538529 RepID=UPI0030B590E5|nr:aldehyde dehydrogenase family protein [Planktomarina temperata]|tara:strand:- start:3019 stop:4494 length:1476 start_codon:yes stop_codon:yes gene_type:complete
MLENITSGPVIKGLYIDGQWQATPGQFDDFNPSDGTVWAQIPDAGASETKRAIDAAHRAFPTWSSMHFQHRAQFLLKIADIWDKRSADYVAAAQYEGGGGFGKGMFEVGHVSETFRAAAGLCYGPIGEILPSQHGKVSTAVRVPMGVIGVISPWNVPGILTSRGFAFAMAAGNTIVLKPSEETPYGGGLFFGEILQEAGVPNGVFNVITASRSRTPEVGDELIDNPLVKGISFTGSTPVGRRIAAKCGAHLKKCCIELGGKDSLIILEDADMDRATSSASFGAFMHQGQICMSVEKVLVHNSIYDDFLQKFVARAGRIKTGNTADKSNVNGPLINDRQVARVKSQLDDAIAKGAQIALGGGINGRFVEPTILTHVTPDMDIWRDETFGPVAIVVPFKTDAEAIVMNNDTEYGLSSGIITGNEQRALDMSQHLETGMCHVNCSTINDEPHAPFGGSKASGLGRHGGKWAMDTFSETRWITMDRGGRPYPPVF